MQAVCIRPVGILSLVMQEVKDEEKPAQEAEDSEKMLVIDVSQSVISKMKAADISTIEAETGASIEIREDETDTKQVYLYMEYLMIILFTQAFCLSPLICLH